jgi:hypothetical protein
MVPQASAVVSGTADAKPVAISADHLNMVKFVFCLNEGYEKVFKYLQLLAEERQIQLVQIERSRTGSERV